MNKELFDDAIGEVPRSTVDVEAVITRGRRAARIRQVANPAVAAGVAVVLAVGAIAFTMTRGDDGGIGVGGPTTTSTTAAPVPNTSDTATKGALPPEARAPEGCSRPNLETGAQAAARLSPVAKAAFHAQRPDLQLVDNPINTYPEGVPHPALDFYQVTGDMPVDMSICDKDSYFQARATIKSPEGDGSILIAAFPYFFDAMPGCEEYTAESDCEVLSRKGVEQVVKTTDASESGVVVTQVSVLHKDGTLVRVNVQNTGTDVRDGNGPGSPEVPLTLDQMLAIAADPGLTLFP
jgi:hypothetical protein